MTYALEVEDLSTHIQLSRSVVKPVGEVSFHIQAGETLGLVGESGCGKSMTGLSIMGLLPPGGEIVGGSITVEGKELVGLPDATMRDVRGNDVAMVFQDSMTSLNPTKTIGYQVAETVRRHWGASKAEAFDRAVEVLELVGLPRPKERLGDYPHQLSGGLRQRVLIGIALACEPKVLIADEPTTALDVTIQAQILRLLDDLKDRLGMAVLLITHDMGVVAGRADRVAVMYAGHVVEQTETGRLFRHMRHPYTQGLLGSIPQLDQDPLLPLFTIPGIPPDLAHPPAGCRFADRCAHVGERCRTEEPPLDGPTDEHVFACWHPVDGPLPVRKIPIEPVSGRPGAAAGAPAGATSGATAAGAATPGPAAGDGTAADRPVPTDREMILGVSHVVKEFPVGGGGLIRRGSATVKAVSDVSFEVRRGETFGLVGESGCGKSTLGRLLVALDKPDGGAVLFEGDDLVGMGGRELRRRRRDLQLMFQDPYASLDPRMRVGAILREPLVIQGIGDRKEQERRVADLLREVGLPATSVERFPHEFSGGQRQRIGLARALALNPELIVADEPVSALDVSIRSQVLNLVKRLQGLHGLTYVVISHDLSVVKYLSDRIGVMYLGRLVEVGPSDQIYAAPAHHYTAGLIQAIPVPDPEVERSKTSVAVQGELPSSIDPPSGCRFRTRCPAAQDLCAAEVPPMRHFGPGHWAACHFPLVPPVDESGLEAVPGTGACEEGERVAS